jgi:hypothetical protein
MPYDNKLNRLIAEKLRENYKKNIEHWERIYDPKFSRVVIGSAKKTLINDSNITKEKLKIKDLEDGKDDYDSGDENILEPSHYKSQKLEHEEFKEKLEERAKEKEDKEKVSNENKERVVGGALRTIGGALGSIGGFAEGTVRDLGEERQKGVRGTIKRKKVGGKPLRPFIKAIKRRSKIANPLNIIDTIAGTVSSLGIPVVSDVSGKVKKATNILKKLMPEKEKKEEPKEETKEEPKEEKKGYGKKTKKTLLLKRPSGGSKNEIGILKKKGRPSKMKKLGGAESLAMPYNMINSKTGKTGITDITGGRKYGRVVKGNTKLKGEDKKPIEKVVPEAQMQSSTLSGFGKPKKINKRLELVKKIMNEKGLKMIEASKYVKEHNLYKK